MGSSSVPARDTDIGFVSIWLFGPAVSSLKCVCVKDGSTQQPGKGLGLPCIKYNPSKSLKPKNSGENDEIFHDRARCQNRKV